MMTARKTRVRYVVTFEGAAEGPHLRALRFVLKRLLRSHRLQCTDARQLNPRDDVPGRADDGDDGEAQR
jgi:hypothetical protein